MGPIVVRACNVSVAYGQDKPLKNVNVEIRDGEFVALVGKSGTGKSSFLNAIAGFIPYDGIIELTGSIGYVFQSNALFPWFKVKDNIAFGIRELPAGPRRAKVRNLLERIEMQGFAEQYPHQLSGGQIQRVALARALAPDPKVLLMDEPYAALDHHTREKMQTWLLSVWKDSQKTIIFVTHFIEEAIFLADRVVVLSEGRFSSEVQVPFARPRSDDLRFSERFLDLKKEILDYMQ
jgi:ABC-type nitrate/sulfonate/bicarbonate transport system ATPase subunit